MEILHGAGAKADDNGDGGECATAVQGVGGSVRDGADGVCGESGGGCEGVLLGHCQRYWGGGGCGMI